MWLTWSVMPELRWNVSLAKIDMNAEKRVPNLPSRIPVDTPLPFRIYTPLYCCLHSTLPSSRLARVREG